MAKLHRDMNPLRVEQSKERTIEAVMNRIERRQQPSVWRRLARPVLAPALVLAFVIALLVWPDAPTPPITDDPVVLSAYDTGALAELTYLSSSFITTDVVVSQPGLLFLNVNDETAFEQEDEMINRYFDTLRVYLEDVDFTQVVQVQVLENEGFDYRLTFEVHNTTYVFLVSLVGDAISGELVVGGVTFIVTGSFEETETETSIELEAERGSDYVHISYQYEDDGDIEREFEIETSIQGVTTNREISVELEGDEASVSIQDGENEYTLKRENEDGITKYKLEYSINGIEGEATIVEEEDINGNPVFRYSVKEGEVEKDIERGRPDYGYDRDDDDDDDPGRGNNDEDDEDDEEEDEDDEEFPGNGDPQNQSYEDGLKRSTKSL
jgi:hypothetical protein